MRQYRSSGKKRFTKRSGSNGRPPGRSHHRRLLFETLENRRLLSDVCVVPFWDGERVDGTDGPTMLNYSGGGLGPSSGATINYTTAVVHSGQGGYCITVSPTLAQGGFATVSTTLGATGSPAPYMDTRDLTPYQDISCWVNNQTGTRSRCN